MSKISHTSAPRLYETAVPSNGADAYYDISDHTMAAQSNKSFNKKTNGTFGSTGRDSNSWLNKGGTRDENTPRSGTPNGNRRASHTPSDMAPLRSTFGANANAHRQKGPSAAMGGGSRFAPTKQAAPGPGEYYTPPALGAQKSGNFNKSGNGTMGTTKRFQAAKEAAPGDYSDARPGAFTKSQNGRSSNTGFGGTVSRVSVFEQAANAAAANASSHLSYDAHASTGAFAKATQATGASSAAFASKSSQHTGPKVAEGPAPGSYSTAARTSTFTSKSFNKSYNRGSGGFGTSARRESGISSSREPDAPGPGEYAPSDFAAPRPQSARPSAAFASTTKKMADLHTRGVEGPSASDYDAHKSDGMAANVLKTFNKQAGGTMGTTKRFQAAKEAAPGDYSDARPGAFTKSQNGRSSNTGFGGTVSRVSVFEQAANAAAANASSHLSYDAHASTGAFAKAMQATGASSAAFASKSSQHGSAAKAEGERGADFLNLQASGSMAKAAGSSFNKSLKAGTGGFGTSAKRGSDMLSARSADAPGPGEYDLSQRVDSKPSAAFASTTKKEATYVRDVSDGAGMSEYDAHKSDGMAATASKSFNRHVGTGGFGPRAAREMHGKSRDTPGPGEYQSADPSKPTVDNHAKSSKGKVSGVFASTTLRDTSSWAIPGMR
jgi:hypothetical protein